LFVQAVDRKFYQDPVFSGSDWVVLFQDAPTISIRDIGKPTLSRAKETLADVPIEASSIRAGNRERTIINGKLTWCYTHEFTLDNMIPVPEVSGPAVSVPNQSAHMIGFETEFDTEILARAILGMEVDTLLCRALMKQVYYKKQIEQIRPELAKKLYTQHPFLRELDRKTWEKQLEAHPRKVVVKWRVT